jgi:hypothetical protein
MIGDQAREPLEGEGGGAEVGAMGLPRPVGVGGLPVDATGHPTWLTIRIWFRSDPSVERNVRSVLAGAGREWVAVVRPLNFSC